MDIRVYYTVKPATEAAAVITAMDEKHRRCMEARAALAKELGMHGPVEVPPDKDPRREDWEARYPKRWGFFHGTRNLLGFGILVKGENGDTTGSVEIHRRWLAVTPGREARWKIKDGALVPRHNTPEGRDIAKRMADLPSDADSDDLHSGMLIPLKVKDANARRHAGFYIGKSYGLGLSMLRCSLHRPKDHAPIVSIPAAALNDKAVRLARGLVEMKASKVAALLQDDD